MRAVGSEYVGFARSSVARVRRLFFLLTMTYIDVGYPSAAFGRVRNYGDVFRSGCRSQPFGGDLGQKGVKIAAGEGPFEGRCRPLIVDLEGKETLFKFGQRREVVGREDLPLYDGEIDFDLIEPTGVDRSVDEDRVGPFGAEAVDGFLATMSGAVVHNPEDAASGLVGLLVHDFADEALHRSHPILDFAAAEDLGAMDVPSSQVGPGTFAKVLVLDPVGRFGAGGNVGCFRRRA